MMKNKAGTRWRQGLVARTLLAVLIVAVALACLSSVIVSNSVHVRETEQAIQALNELVETVTDSANIAAFTNDDQLAAEVVEGLMSNGDVFRVTIRSTESTLASDDRGTALIANDVDSLTHSLSSPFQPNEIIGEIILTPDWEKISVRISETIRETLLIQIGQMVLVLAIIAAIMLYLVVRPIKDISDRLHRLGIESDNLLQVPHGHENSEIGQLVGDINALTGRLVATLEQERVLQQKQIIARRKYENLFDQATSGIFVANSDGQLESFNRAFSMLTCLPNSQQKENRSLFEIGWRNPEQLLPMLSATSNTEQNIEQDLVLFGQNGTERWLHIEVLALGDGNVQGTISDVTQRKKEELTAKQQVITDTLTGFSNRAGLQLLLQDATADTLPFALVLIDINRFKEINDAFGFYVGDQLLLRVSTRIKTIMQEGDSAARVDSDQFVLVLQHEQDPSSLNQRMDHLVSILTQAFELTTAAAPSKKNSVSINISMGIAFFPKDGGKLNDLLRSAELALNSAEERSESQYYYFDPAQQAAVEQRRHLEDDLRHAIIAKELYVVYQPIVDLHNAKVVGAEALIRWSHPERGMIFPDTFIPLAEQTGLINDIGLLVLDDACRQVSQWHRDGINIYVSINVSAKQIPNGLNSVVLAQALERYKLPPSAIAIEITESLLLANITVAQTWIESVRLLGVRTYLDDFGTGYSSLSYLKRFPMDTVKIDRSFIRDLYLDKSDRALSAAIINMANSLDLNVIAEGVEDEKQLSILRELGCRNVQGYYFSRPVKGLELAPTILRINRELVNQNQWVRSLET